MGFRKKFAAAASALATLAVLALASTASASSHHPTGEFSQFGECPLNNGALEGCVFATFNGGSYTIGSKTISVVNPITLQGGYVTGGSGLEFHGAENGDTLSKTAQPVPGGLVGITAPTSWPLPVQEWFNEQISLGFTGINATLELAAPATSIALNLENLIFEEGTALGLPTKIKLDNSILGNNCYIGSNAAPVQIDLTTGTSGSLTGSAGTLTFNGAFTLITLSGTTLVNNTFAAPAAEGCGGVFSAYVDPLINSIFGLPAASGQNSMDLQGNLKIAEPAAVRAVDP